MTTSLLRGAAAGTVLVAALVAFTLAGDLEDDEGPLAS
jgi:hypothetical protein